MASMFPIAFRKSQQKRGVGVRFNFDTIVKSLLNNFALPYMEFNRDQNSIYCTYGPQTDFCEIINFEPSDETKKYR